MLNNLIQFVTGFPRSTPLLMVGLVSIFCLIYVLIKWKLFNKFFEHAQTKRFSATVNELKSKRIIYTSLSEYQEDIRQTFCEKLKINSANIILLDEKNRQQCRHLIEFFREKSTTLTTKEARPKNLRQEAVNLGKVIMPLFHPSKELIGFLVLGEKESGGTYSKAEVSLLEKIRPNLGLKLTVTLFSARLRKQVSRKIEVLKKQNKRINEILSQQADFISVSAHELRTPLAIALLQTELLAESLPKNEKIESTRTALIRLQDLVQKLFNVQHHDLSKATLNLRQVNFTDFVTKTFNNFEPLTQKKSINLILKNNISKDFQIKIDPLQLRQVFQNLLSNALKFTPKKGKIILQVEKHGKELRFYITDSGCGIPKKMCKAIFEKFRSVKASKGQGIGLGLYLCKKIVELHHGKIWAEATKIGGAKFCISLPY